MASLWPITSSTRSGCWSEKYAPIEYRLVSMSDSRKESLLSDPRAIRGRRLHRAGASGRLVDPAGLGAVHDDGRKRRRPCDGGDPPGDRVQRVAGQAVRQGPHEAHIDADARPGVAAIVPEAEIVRDPGGLGHGGGAPYRLWQGTV